MFREEQNVCVCCGVVGDFGRKLGFDPDCAWMDRSEKWDNLPFYHRLPVHNRLWYVTTHALTLRRGYSHSLDPLWGQHLWPLSDPFLGNLRSVPVFRRL